MSNSKATFKKKGDIIYHPDTNLVIKGAKEKVVIGKLVDGEVKLLEESDIETCNEIGMKYDVECVAKVKVDESESGEEESESEDDESGSEEDEVQSTKTVEPVKTESVKTNEHVSVEEPVVVPRKVSVEDILSRTHATHEIAVHPTMHPTIQSIVSGLNLLSESLYHDVEKQKALIHQNLLLSQENEKLTKELSSVRSELEETKRKWGALKAMFSN